MSHSLTAEIRSLLSLQPDRTAIITVGNPLRSDDGVGPYIASRLKPPRQPAIIDAGSNPENSIEEAIALKPRHIVIIDAAAFGGEPGEARLIDQEHIPETSVSTHMISLKVVALILAEETKAQISFLGIQPKYVGIGEGLSAEVQETADAIVGLLLRGTPHLL